MAEETRRSFDLKSWQGLTEVLKVARESNLTPEAYANFRNLVLEYAQQKGTDVALKKKIDDIILSFDKPQKGDTESNGKDGKNTQRAGRRVIPSFMPKFSAVESIDDAVASPPPPAPAPTPQPVPQPVVEVAPVPPPLSPEPVPAPAPVAQPPVVAEYVPGSLMSIEEYRVRIMDIKRRVNSLVGNPIALVDHGNHIGRDYMSALLNALKATSPGTTLNAEEAMATLESCFGIILNHASHPDNGDSANAPVVSAPSVSPEPEPQSPSPTPTPVLPPPPPILPPVPAPQPAPPVPTPPQPVVAPEPQPLPVPPPQPVVQPPVVKAIPVETKSYAPPPPAYVEEKVSAPVVKEQTVVKEVPPPPAPEPKLPPVVVVEDVPPSHPHTLDDIPVLASIEPSVIKESAVALSPVVENATAPSSEAEGRWGHAGNEVDLETQIKALRAELKGHEVGEPKREDSPSAHRSRIPSIIEMEEDPLPEPETQESAQPYSASHHDGLSPRELTQRPDSNLTGITLGTPQAELVSPDVTMALTELLHEWNIFASSGLFGMGPGGIEHPLYIKLSRLQMIEVLGGRFENADMKVVHTIKDYINAWRHEQGIAYNPSETFEHYLRRVAQRILKRQKGVRDN